ncbi:hypothetical protein DWF00_19760 [Bosea caraganae]|uniref:Intracellular septation protein A n=1 Tax=Bosea caraganae TaxID=2763117 RepID=A0A370KXI4_9HYPH|nr:hypothetical protein [Bosea caraganae]RDJ19656.1 hypothetical protein DWE98_28595 [Bosea caraganae]RDJ24314.1 hypothetical protein DWF00_19760 [Bosea caraganae]
MGILFAFAPFVAFALVDRVSGSFSGLLAGAIVSVGLLARDMFAGRAPKILELGSVLLFGGLALYAGLTGTEFAIMAGRLLVDGGLLLIVLISLVAGVPFTLQYAREQVPSELWGTPAFRQTNVVITCVWAFAFAVITAADALLLLRTDVPRHVGIWVIVAAIVGAVKFTGWYPERSQTGKAV